MIVGALIGLIGSFPLGLVPVPSPTFITFALALVCSAVRFGGRVRPRALTTLAVVSAAAGGLWSALVLLIALIWQAPLGIVSGILGVVGMFVVAGGAILGLIRAEIGPVSGGPPRA